MITLSVICCTARENPGLSALVKSLEEQGIAKELFELVYCDKYNRKELKKILSDSGNMVSFVVNGGDDEGRKMLNNMNVASQAISLGGVESLISMPYATTHASWTQEARVAAGIDLGFVRFSTGLEDFDDLKNDFDQALSSL